MKRMQEEIATAQTIVFLGFGFYSKNLDLLKPQTKTAATTVIATALFAPHVEPQRYAA
jgi:hypothetical protein